VLQNLTALGSSAPKLRMAKMEAGPIVSDNGNFIIDAPFPEEQMKDPLTVSTIETRYEFFTNNLASS
jgi:ribose 5-phosphate isomerase A